MWIFNYNEPLNEDSIPTFLLDWSGVESLIDQKRKLDKCKTNQIIFFSFLKMCILSFFSFSN